MSNFRRIVARIRAIDDELRDVQDDPDTQIAESIKTARLSLIETGRLLEDAFNSDLFDDI